MPTIPYPDIPAYPGVPNVPRSSAVATATSIVLSSVGSLLLSALESDSQWGIYDSTGSQLGGVDDLSLVSQPTVLSTYSFDYTKETRISDFPVEAGGFASYNKVEMPATPTVVLALSGPEDARTTFLNALDVAVKSTGLYSIATPELTYTNYSLTRMSYRRAAEKGATLLMVEIALEEVRQVSAAYATVAPIANPQNVSATSQTNDGNVQPTKPDVSTLKSLIAKFPTLGGTQ